MPTGLVSRRRRAIPRRLQDHEDPVEAETERSCSLCREGAGRPRGHRLHGEGQQEVPDTGGWGYAQFDYDPASDTFTPNTSLQGSDATCGAACHTAAEATDYVFTAYRKR